MLQSNQINRTRHKLCLAFCFVFSVFYRGSAQTSTYYPLPDSNAIWRVDWSSSFQCTNWNHLAESYQYTIMGDSVVGTKSFRKIYKSGDKYCQTQVTHYGPQYVGAVRQDLANRKVYFLPVGFTTDTLLYNFNLTIGQPVPATYFGTAGDTLKKTDSVFVGSGYRKRFVFSKSRPIIEGIGSTAGLLECKAGQCTSEDGWGLVCFHDSISSWFSRTSMTSCDMITGIRNLDERKSFLAIFPNPAPPNSMIEIENRKGEGDGVFQLSDSFGRINLLRKVHYSEYRFLLLLPDLPPGLYTYSYYEEKGNLAFHGKLIVE
jgi:hypothetical protein